jgi:cytochrome bd-type quinol oxidase subunit 1
MDLPVIQTPVFPRWVWIEEITYSHIPIATAITTYMLLAPLFEYIGWRREDLRWERLSRSLIWFSLILFSPGAALGTGIPMFIIGTYPEFWARWSNLFFWPLMVQFVFFLAEVVFLFFLYYLTWDRWAQRKRLHISMGVCAAIFGYLVQIVWDSLGGYMLTPGGVALPQANEPIAWSWAAFMNPSFPFLLFHRTFGNFSYVMLLTGGVLALRHMGQRRKNPQSENTAYFRWASSTCFTIGFFSFFAQPVLGWFYARVIQREAPAAFLAIMGGHVSPHFTFKMGLILFLLVMGGTYIAKQWRHKTCMIAISMGLLVLLAVVWLHPPLLWLGGSEIVWRVVSTGVILCLMGWFWWWGRRRGDTDRLFWQWSMFAVGLTSLFIFVMGGFVRERSKSPDTVYGEIQKPEQTSLEADRYLVYTKWLKPRNQYPEDLVREKVENWRQEVEQARQVGVELTDEEAERIIRYLEEHH